MSFMGFLYVCKVQKILMFFVGLLFCWWWFAFRSFLWIQSQKAGQPFQEKWKLGVVFVYLRSSCGLEYLGHAVFVAFPTALGSQLRCPFQWDDFAGGCIQNGENTSTLSMDLSASQVQTNDLVKKGKGGFGWLWHNGLFVSSQKKSGDSWSFQNHLRAKATGSVCIDLRHLRRWECVDSGQTSAVNLVEHLISGSLWLPPRAADCQWIEEIWP